MYNVFGSGCIFQPGQLLIVRILKIRFSGLRERHKREKSEEKN